MTLVQSEPKAIKIGTTDVKAVYLGENKVRPSGWTPGSDIIAYFPLNSEYENNSYDGTISLTMGASGYTYNQKWTSFTANIRNNCAISGMTTTYTLFGWINTIGDIRIGATSSGGTGRDMNRSSATELKYNRYINTSGTGVNYTITSGWHSFIASCTSTANDIYIDGVLVGSPDTPLSATSSYLIVNGKTGGDIAKVGVSNTNWSAAQCLAFHNGTKADFGL